ncbi:hypothetical protein [Arthrobacter bambusae]|uniref:Uncharacterized protein n=1 Tax=Arthrobacter bambusae TaxID=1338426 RepID=A0AAW8D5R8_9MICC|nr:hypothetical protein [Arthrobacter bambusae]MDP9903218.1 hypothetical protein [Arthrobacter bambusae]MDQ0128788.1 hypothetical protein [Arthrobacter bambusae]MDQ0180129.1 hypothetical protein [Arthrobacter bambusae]
MSTAPVPKFTDKLGATGEAGDQVIVPVLDQDGYAQLTLATVVEVIRQAPSPFTSELSVRTRVDNEESCIYEPEDIIVLAPPASARVADSSTTHPMSLEHPIGATKACSP